MEYGRQYVTQDGEPVWFKAAFRPISQDVDGREISLPDENGWWILESYSGTVPPALQAKIDKVYKDAPQGEVGYRVVAPSNQWEMETRVPVTGAMLRPEDHRLIATLVLAEVRKPDDHNFVRTVSKLVAEQETLMATLAAAEEG